MFADFVTVALVKPWNFSAKS